MRDFVETTPVFDPAGFDSETCQKFGQTPTQHTHSLHRDPMFTDAGLAALLDRYPREHIGVYRMGDTVDSWECGRLGAISGASLVQAVKDGRIWLNLRDAHRRDPTLADINDRVFDELKQLIPGFRPFNTDLGLLISSPGARVFYHLDVPRVMLLHLRGHKNVWVYPRSEPFVEAAGLESVVSEKTEEEIPYLPEFDAGGKCYRMAPGQMVHWPQNAPHRIDNGDDLNVSLSIEFMTPTAQLRANAVLANAWLRDRFGLKSGIESKPNIGWLPKFVLARLLRILEPRDRKPTVIPHTFRLEES
ncbi:MAG: hypothetical protein DHS20C06_12610 [Hyphobacterium sp.]|nr:MAG: hypothetical protein DHS20C06_12610 [Hyphobacterium sp.]